MTKISFERQMVERKMTWGRASTTIGSLVILFYLQCLIREKRHSTKAKPVQLCSVEFKFVKYCVFYWKFGARLVTMLTTARRCFRDEPEECQHQYYWFFFDSLHFVKLFLKSISFIPITNNSSIYNGCAPCLASKTLLPGIAAASFNEFVILCFYAFARFNEPLSNKFWALHFNLIFIHLKILRFRIKLSKLWLVIHEYGCCNLRMLHVRSSPF